ncbi:hypothetical protein [Campylobacter sp. RM16187]|uniref:hypothetical protein n=1 Tax=Campylobacter sp. RM16187 TaxID=1660063 RepID=UPI0021B68F37|nr:hypothetical protein [Campylobacter sp. RM16187]QKG29720.1 hypothetical protein CDOMF_1482 [Campylobacter sp. RM16187]
MKTIQMLVGLEHISASIVRKIIFILLLVLIVIMSGGCANKPEMIVQTEYKEVSMPVKCEAVLPQNVKFNEYDPQTWIDIGKYHSEVEILLKACTGEEPR